MQSADTQRRLDARAVVGHAGPDRAPPAGEVRLPADASAVRSRGFAVAALAAITGYDARLDEKEAARTIAEAASVYARICRLPPE